MYFELSVDILRSWLLRLLRLQHTSALKYVEQSGICCNSLSIRNALTFFTPFHAFLTAAAGSRDLKADFRGDEMRGLLEVT